MDVIGAIIDAAIAAATKSSSGSNHAGDYSHLTVGVLADSDDKKG